MIDLSEYFTLSHIAFSLTMIAFFLMMIFLKLYDNNPGKKHEKK